METKKEREVSLLFNCQVDRIYKSKHENTFLFHIPSFIINAMLFPGKKHPHCLS